MKLAIMQPYFLPYLGYWQLLNLVERFVIYDDVNFIKGGWINRNRILINGKSSYITVPLHQASPNKLICDISLQASSAWQIKMTKSVENAYRKAPFFSDIFPIIKQVIYYKTDNLADFLVHQLKIIIAFLGINTEVVKSCRKYKNNDLHGQDRILDICKREEASVYINLQGGQALYNAAAFLRQGIDLYFMVMQQTPYAQRSPGFVASLSLIDALMETGPQAVAEQLDKFDLLSDENLHV